MDVCAHCDHAMFGATTKYKRIVPGSIGRVRINNQRLIESVKSYRSWEQRPAPLCGPDTFVHSVCLLEQQMCHCRIAVINY